jgi:hypothetical protein
VVQYITSHYVTLHYIQYITLHYIAIPHTKLKFSHYTAFSTQQSVETLTELNGAFL